MPAPQVSVVLPTRNRSSMLSQSLGSALGQTGVELEVIVVDEGSSDGTAEQLVAIDDPRLTVVRHDTPKGLAAARNAAIARARGEWLAFLDDDDFWAPSKLRAQLDGAAQHGLSLSYTTSLMVDQDLSVIRVTRGPDPAGLERRLLLSNPIPSASGVAVRADLLDRVGVFDEFLPALEDWDLWIRAAPTAAAGGVDEPLIATRLHAEGMSTDPTRMLRAFEMLREKHGERARREGIDFGAAWVARYKAARDLAEGHRLRAARGYLECARLERNPRHAARALGALGGSALKRRHRRATARTIRQPDWLERHA
jgi:glycosyltransferase involved in cell wall biosynthesis